MDTQQTVVFWQNQPSMHQSSMVRNLADLPGYEVLLVTQSEISGERMELGWYTPDYGRTERIGKPTSAEINRILASNASPGSVHIFSGLNVYPGVKTAFQRSQDYPVRRGIYGEAFHPEGVRGIYHRLQTRCFSIRYRNAVDFLLAVGEKGVSWYRRNGFSGAEIFQFGYWVESHQPDEKLHHPGNHEEYVILFVGQLIHRKGVDFLLRALRKLNVSNPWKLWVVGEGPQRDNLTALAKELEIFNHIRWSGSIPNQRIRRMLFEVDLAVLPSRHDGWGAITNEALMSGVPMICSDSCGSAVLVNASGFGAVFPSGDSDRLSALIQKHLEKGKLSMEKRKQVMAWSEAISGEAGAQYLDQIITYLDNRQLERPIPPWEATI